MKKILTMIMVFSLAIVSACSNGEASSENSVELSVAHIFPDSHPGGIFLDELAKELEEETDGELTLQVNHNAVLGSESDQIQQMQSGNLDMSLFHGGSNFQAFDEAYGVEELPFVFSDIEHARKAFDGEYGSTFKEKVAEHNFEIISYWENGFRHFTNNSQPIEVPADMKGISFRSAEIPLRLDMFETLNASAVSMGFDELYTGLQQGTVDGQENPLSVIDSSNFYEVQDYLSLSGHIYNSSPLTMTKQSREKLTDEQLETLTNISEDLKMEQREMLDQENQELEAFLSEQGMEINEINRDKFVDAVQPVWESYAEQHGEELVNLILEAE